ncbi:MAG TPA: Gfo/Idh/MocA family oxidoreductase [Verrucomicrobiae bacterium]|nr:Gfo/Idh/MocA family oxidoreductase [Verrucomicrobiae bacterium]
MRTPLTRRQFVARATGAFAATGFPAIIPARVLGQGASTPPSKMTTIGFIGVGGRGTALLKNLVAFPEARILAVCDAYQDRREKAKGIVDKEYRNSDCAMLADFRDVLARKDIDGVVIAAQDHWHAIIAKAAAEAGKQMYCEKPLGVSIGQSRAIVDAVRKAGVVFQTGTQQRSDKKFRDACELARNGYVGKIHTVQVAAPGPQYRPKYTGPMEPQPVPDGFDWAMWRGPAPEKPYNPGRVAWPDWYLIWDYCAGFIVNWGVHHLDIALWGCPALGEQTCDIECSGDYRNEGFTDNINGWNATFTYPGGLKMLFTDAGQGEIGCKFIGDQGWVRADRSGIWAEPESLLKVQLKPSDTRLHESFNHGDDWLIAVRGKSDPVSPVEAGHKATITGMAAEIAARLRRKLKWDPKAERFIGDDEANKMLTRPMHNGWKL